MKAILLAAGASSRMGRPKQLLRCGNKCLLQSVIDQLNEAEFDVITVLGAHHELIASEIRDCRLMINHQWHQGMGQSILSGLSRLESDEPVLMALADQIALQAQDFISLRKKHQAQPQRIIASYFIDLSKNEKIVGVPAIFPSQKINLLCALKPDQGAKKIIRNLLNTPSNEDVLTVHLQRAANNINTQQDWENWQLERQQKLKERTHEILC